MCVRAYACAWACAWAWPLARLVDGGLARLGELHLHLEERKVGRRVELARAERVDPAGVLEMGKQRSTRLMAKQ
eukprot:3106689-Prymnesium_polylepis.1